MLTISDADGKELAKNDDAADGRTDSHLVFTAPKAGRYVVKVSDRFATRGGPDFAYRLRATPVTTADFALTPAEFAAFIAAEIDLWGKVIRATGARAD